MSERFDFDQFARDMAGGLSRREALGRLGSALAGALLASLGLGRRAFSAPASNSQCQDFCRNTCGVKPGGGNAFGQCVSSCQQCLNSSSAVCAWSPAGSSAVVCCLAGQLCCGGSCCASGHYCCSNQCSLCSCDKTLCTGSQGTNCCSTGQTCCDGKCCPSGQYCCNNQCSVCPCD